MKSIATNFFYANFFLLSVAILQYLADKYKVDETFYPADAQQRALVNHRLAFHMSTYYKAVVNYIVRVSINTNIRT